MNKQWLSIMAVGLSAAVALADVVTLNDGRQFSGSIRYSGDDVVITQADGSSVTVARNDVAKVALISTLTPAQIADAEWARLLIVIKNAKTIDQIMANVSAFLERYGDQPIAAEAKKVLAQYQQAKELGYIKLGSKWVSPDEANKLREKSAEAAQSALNLYRAGKNQDAITQAKAALAVDDQNVNAINIQALALIRMNQPNQARPLFAQAAEMDATNVLALNNLAVLTYALNRDAEALVYYGRALAAAPQNRLLLDNIAEALNDYDGSKYAQSYKDMIARVQQADTRMASLMAQKGLFRYGSSWVTQEQHERLSANMQKINDAQNALGASYRASMVTYNSAQKELKDNDRLYDANLNIYNAMTSAIQVAVTHGYPVDAQWIYDRDNSWSECNRLSARRTQLVDQINQARTTLINMRPEAERLKKLMNAATALQFSGVQRLIEPGDVENPPPPAAVVIPPELQNVAATTAPAPAQQASLPPPQVVNPGRQFDSGGMTLVVTRRIIPGPVIIIPPAPGPRPPRGPATQPTTRPGTRLR